MHSIVGSSSVGDDGWLMMVQRFNAVLHLPVPDCTDSLRFNGHFPWLAGVY